MSSCKCSLWLFIVTCTVCLGQAETSNDPATKPISIAVLPMENVSRGDASAHWQSFLPRLLDSHLTVLRSVRVLPQSSVRFGFAEVRLRQGQALNADQARAIGKIIEAQYVVWGSFNREGESWRINYLLLRVGSTNSAEKWTISSTNLITIEQESAVRAVRALGLSLSAEEKLRVFAPTTSSPEALNLILKAADGAEAGEPLSKSDAYARQAVSLDPQSARAWSLLANILAAETKLDEAKEAVEKAISLRPGDFKAHQIQGLIFYIAQSYKVATDAFWTAIQLNQFDADSYLRLAEISRMTDQPDEAIKYFRKATELEPYSSTLHAGLGYAYAMQGRRPEALAELIAAEKFSCNKSDAESIVGSGYRSLNMLPEAVNHYEKWIAY